MIPLLYSGDMIKFIPIRFDKIKTDDIVLTNKSKKFIIHRVIYKTNTFLITKGDNNYQSDLKTRNIGFFLKAVEVKRGPKRFLIDDAYLLQSVNYLKELKIICKIFAANNIKFAVLKGLPLYLKYLNGFPKRFYADCDLLILPDQFNLCKIIFQKLGYRIKNTNIAKLFNHSDFSPEVTFIKSVDRIRVEFDIHTQAVFLMKQFAIPEVLYPNNLLTLLSSHFLNSRRSVKIQGINFPILSPANLIVYLGLHFFHHNFRGISRLEFLNKVIIREFRRKTGKKILAKKIKQLVLKFNLSNFVIPAFILCSKLFKNKYLKEIIIDTKKLPKLDFKQFEKNIFDSESRYQAGKNRFKLILRLSPNPTLIKYLTFLDKNILAILFRYLFFKFLNQQKNEKI